MKMATGLSIDHLLKEVIGLAMKVHRTLGSGFKENVYVNSLCLELAKASIPFEHEKPTPVFYDGHVVGDFVTDLIVDGRLVIEAKAVESLTTAHSVQLVNYLAATKIDDGLLLNFGARSLQFKNKVRDYDKTSRQTSSPRIPLIPSQNSVNSV
jgi:GxxExxY protein